MDVLLVLILGLAALLLLIVAWVVLAWLAWRSAGGRGAGPDEFLAHVILRRRTRALGAAVVNQLATITRLNLPFPDSLAATALAEKGSLRRVLLDLAQRLEEGTSVSVALRGSIPCCPAIVETIVRAGEDSGQLPRALSILEQLLNDRLRTGFRFTEGYWVYPLVLVLGMIGIVAGVMIKIVPKFKEIFADFDAVLPASTVALVDVSRWLTTGPVGCCAGYPVTTVIVLGLLFLFVWPRSAGRPNWHSRVADTLRWWLPGIRDIERSWGTAASVDVLGMGMAAGLPLDLAAQYAGEIDVNVHVRRRFRWFARLVAQGEPPGQAARRAGLDPVVAGAVASVVRGCDPDLALGHAARYHRATAYRAWYVLSQLVWPAVTVVSASVVGFVALALFEPLVRLIDCTMGATGVM